MIRFSPLAWEEGGASREPGEGFLPSTPPQLGNPGRIPLDSAPHLMYQYDTLRAELHTSKQKRGGRHANRTVFTRETN